MPPSLNINVATMSIVALTLIMIWFSCTISVEGQYPSGINDGHNTHARHKQAIRPGSTGIATTKHQLIHHTGITMDKFRNALTTDSSGFGEGSSGCTAPNLDSIPLSEPVQRNTAWTEWKDCCLSTGLNDVTWYDMAWHGKWCNLNECKNGIPCTVCKNGIPCTTCNGCPCVNGECGVPADCPGPYPTMQDCCGATGSVGMSCTNDYGCRGCPCDQGHCAGGY